MIFISSYRVFISYIVQSTTAWFYFLTISVLRYIKGNQWHTCVKVMIHLVVYFVRPHQQIIPPETSGEACGSAN